MFQFTNRQKREIARIFVVVVVISALLGIRTPVGGSPICTEPSPAHS